jgi:PAS domain S-box-containing protein
MNQDKPLSELEDIQDRLASAERALQESEERFHLLFENVPLEYQSLDEAGRILDVNQAWLETFGYHREEVIGSRFGDFLDPLHMEKFKENLAKSASTGEIHWTDFRMVRKDGSTISVALHGYRDRDPYGITTLHAYVERNGSESARWAEDQRLVDAIEFQPDATFVIDQRKRIIAWNRACEEMTGVKKQALLGLGDYAYAEPFFGERRPMLVDFLDLPATELEATYQYINRKDHLISAESFIPRLRGGQGAHLWGVAAPLFDQEGRRCGAIEAIRDITEQKHAENKLRRSEERYRILVEESFDGILVQKGAKIVFANSRLHEMLGYDKGELEGLDHWLIYHPDDQVITQERAQARMRGEEIPSQYEVRLQGKDGASFAGEISAKAVRFDGTAGVQVWVRDITERKLAQERINEANEELRLINRIVSAVTGVLDLRELLERVLDEALNIVGLECGRICLLAPDETLLLTAQKSPSGTMSRDLANNRVSVGGCMCGECARTRSPLIFRNRQEVLEYAARKGRRGESIYFHAAFPLITAGGCVGVLCLFTLNNKKPPERRLKLLETVTGQVALGIENAQLYETNQRHAVELEGRVACRTRELSLAKERAEAADLLKSAFLATMSHELRTPLNSIIGFTGIILQGLAGPLNPEQTKQLEMVRGSARHLLALINDVLDISKIEAGQLEVAIERFDLGATITKVLGIVAPLAEKKGLELHTHISAELEQALGDQRRVEQILLNLLNNAIKFTHRGEIELTAKLVSDFNSPGGTPEPPVIQLSVSDTGMGIKPEDKAILFEPFRQIDTGLARSHEGTGLGLSICKKLMDMMGGTIDVQSQWGRGSIFTLRFPQQKRALS